MEPKNRKHHNHFRFRPKNGMWLPTGGQIGNGHIRVSSLAQGERCKQASKVGWAWGRVVEIHWYIKIDRTYLNTYLDIFCWMQSMHSLGFENAFPSSLLICFYGCLRRIDRLHIKMIAKLTRNQNVFMGVVRVVSSRNSGCYIILETSRLTRIAKLSKKGEAEPPPPLLYPFPWYSVIHKHSS